MVKDKKRDEMKERECGKRNDVKCILNSKHQLYYGKISTFRMHNPRKKYETPRRERERERD